MLGHVIGEHLPRFALRHGQGKPNATLTLLILLLNFQGNIPERGGARQATERQRPLPQVQVRMPPSAHLPFQRRRYRPMGLLLAIPACDEASNEPHWHQRYPCTRARHNHCTRASHTPSQVPAEPAHTDLLRHVRPLRPAAALPARQGACSELVRGLRQENKAAGGCSCGLGCGEGSKRGAVGGVWPCGVCEGSQFAWGVRWRRRRSTRCRHTTAGRPGGVARAEERREVVHLGGVKPCQGQRSGGGGGCHWFC